MTYEEALEAVVRDARPLASETIPLIECTGRALSAPVASGIAVPPWNNAGMDGYAVKRSDVSGASADRGVRLRVIGTSAAGVQLSSLPAVVAGSAVRIMTGAPVPSGADAIIRVEDSDGGERSVREESTRADGGGGNETFIRILNDRDLADRANIRPRGEDIREGETLFDAGTTIGAAHIGALASIGHALVAVHRKPRVAVLSGGDELVTLDRFDEVLNGRRIVSSTTYALPALLSQFGAEVDIRPLVPDTLEATVHAVHDALALKPDMLFTTGGVSVGAHDFIRPALEQCGGSIDFWRARIRPGGPIGHGHIAGIPWLGLPGNPVSTMVTAYLFAIPLLRRLGGHTRCLHRAVRVRMMSYTPTAPPLAHFLRVVLNASADGVLEARVAGAQGSNLMGIMAGADALLHVPEEAASADVGAIYDAYLLPGALWHSHGDGAT